MIPAHKPEELQAQPAQLNEVAVPVAKPKPKKRPAKVRATRMSCCLRVVVATCFKLSLATRRERLLACLCSRACCMVLFLLQAETNTSNQPGADGTQGPPKKAAKKGQSSADIKAGTT